MSTKACQIAYMITMYVVNDCVETVDALWYSNIWYYPHLASHMTITISPIHHMYHYNSICAAYAYDMIRYNHLTNIFVCVLNLISSPDILQRFMFTCCGCIIYIFMFAKFSNVENFNKWRENYLENHGSRELLPSSCEFETKKMSISHHFLVSWQAILCQLATYFVSVGNLFCVSWQVILCQLAKYFVWVTKILFCEFVTVFVQCKQHTNLVNSPKNVLLTISLILIL